MKSTKKKPLYFDEFFQPIYFIEKFKNQRKLYKTNFKLPYGGNLGNFFIMSGSFSVDVISRGFFQSYRRRWWRKRERASEKRRPLLKAIQLGIVVCTTADVCVFFKRLAVPRLLGLLLALTTATCYTVVSHQKWLLERPFSLIMHDSALRHCIHDFFRQNVYHLRGIFWSTFQ